jgi:hypothetical protein
MNASTIRFLFSYKSGQLSRIVFIQNSDRVDGAF